MRVPKRRPEGVQPPVHPGPSCRVAFALAQRSALANPSATAAAGIKVVIVVGPVGSETANYIGQCQKDHYAAQARSYGANVVEIYSPNATGARSKAAARWLTGRPGAVSSAGRAGDS